MGIVDYVPRHHYRGNRAAYYGGPAAFAGAGPLCSTGLRSAPVVHYPPVILYDPPPVVAYPASVAPYADGAPPLAPAYYGTYSDW